MMTNNRREFIKKGSAMAALSVARYQLCCFRSDRSAADKENIKLSGLLSKEYIGDAGIKMCLPISVELKLKKGRWEFGRQLNVLGAVGGIDPRMAGLPEHQAVGL